MYESFYIFLAMDEGNWMILEPIMNVESSAPTEFQSALFISLTRRHGIILSSQVYDDYTVVNAEVCY